ncbi:MAG: hypothetical protein ACT4QG_21100 [Sporichthyaceae bacterium]
MGNPGWDAADAWVFASIGSADGRLPLAELVQAAERGNPFALAELEWTLGKLAGSGLLRIYEDWTLELTDEAASLLEDSGPGSPEYLAIVAERLAFVGPTPCKVKVPKGLLDAAQT